MEDNNVAQQRYELIQSMRNKILSVPQMNKQQLTELSNEFLHYLDIYSDSLTQSDIFYFLGSCYSFQGEDNKSIDWYKKVLLYKESLDVVDIHYMNALYNLSVLYYNSGDDKEALVYCDKYCSLSEKMFIQNPNRILQGYMMAILISTEMMESDTFYKYSAKSISMLASHENDFNPTDLGNFYLAIGSGYYATNDYNNARVYYEKAEQFLSKSDMSKNSTVENYLILLASLAKVYEKMELENKILGCYTKGLKLPVPSNSYIVVLFYDSYAAYLHSIGQTDAGEEIVYNAMQLTKRQDPNSKYHILAVSRYASYLATYKNDLKTASEYYKQCMTYCESHPDDYYLKESVARTYYKVLLAEGETTKALSMVQDLLFASLNQTYDNLYENPQIEGYSIVNRVLYLFRGKYAILKQMYLQTDDIEMLKYATEVNSIIISIIEKMRIGTEIESDKLYLGQSTGDSYESIISDYYTLYNRTGEKKYLFKAFEYSEKGTAASLLATFRETNASQFHLPKEISDLETSLRNDIVYYSSMMDDPFNAGKDINDASGYGDKIMSSIYKLDSLLVSVEKDYPEYYYLKYNTDVVSIDEVTNIFGKKSNYVKYFSSDSAIYVFVINRKYKEVIELPVDSTFNSMLAKYRSLISDSYSTYNAREKYAMFCDVAYGLCQMLIAPIEKYLISDKLYIAPGNSMGNIPFEAFLYTKNQDNDLNYRSLDYLLRKYDISYVYSATFSKEVNNRKKLTRNRSVAMAPTYNECQLSDSQLLLDLPNAREEAMYVSKKTKGDLYLGGSVKESVFKSVADKYEIIHLAMHSLMDSVRNNSSMIFACNEYDGDDGRLYSSEIYSMPLNAKMVVLSSCNTGMGKKFSSEGIVSLARSFLFAGSQSVVMAMWEVEDKSGTQIVESFYNNLRHYQSKSTALRKARLKYLENASQSTTPPYYWASLVIYGDIGALYFPTWWIILAIVILALLCFNRYKSQRIQDRSLL